MISSIFLWGALLVSQGSTLNTAPAQKPLQAKPIAGSNVLQTAYEIKPGSASQFIVDRFLQLERAVGNYDKLPAEKKKEADQKIRQVVSSVLDLEHLGKRAMITYWDELSKTEKGKAQLAEYLKLFKNLVEENYLEKARTYVSGRYQIPLIKEEVTDKFISVHGKIHKDDVDLLLEFRILKEGDVYKVTDVRLDETSLEATYRSSFNRIIRGKGGVAEGFPELLRVMQKRLEELKQGGATRL